MRREKSHREPPLCKCSPAALLPAYTRRQPRAHPELPSVAAAPFPITHGPGPQPRPAPLSSPSSCPCHSHPASSLLPTSTLCPSAVVGAASWPRATRLSALDPASIQLLPTPSAAPPRKLGCTLPPSAPLWNSLAFQAWGHPHPGLPPVLGRCCPCRSAASPQKAQPQSEGRACIKPGL